MVEGEAKKTDDVDSYHIESTYVPKTGAAGGDRVDWAIAWWKRLPLWGKIAIIFLGVGIVGNVVTGLIGTTVRPTPSATSTSCADTPYACAVFHNVETYLIFEEHVPPAKIYSADGQRMVHAIASHCLKGTLEETLVGVDARTCKRVLMLDK